MLSFALADVCRELMWPWWRGRDFSSPTRSSSSSELGDALEVCISMMGEFAFDLRRFKGILLGLPHPGDVRLSASTTISCGLMSMRPATLCWN